MPVSESSRTRRPIFGPARPFVLTALLPIALLASGCEPQASPGAGAPAAKPTPADASYSGLEGFPDPVTLRDGKYAGEPSGEGAGAAPSVLLSKQHTAAGDLDGDGISETVVVLVTDSGSGVLFHLAALTEKADSLQHVATAGLGDRIRIRSIAVENGRVRVALLAPGPTDPACCPTQLVRREYALGAAGLAVVDEHYAGPLTRVAGHLIWNGGERSFLSCDGKTEGWPVDRIERESVEDLVQRLASAPDQAVFIDVGGRWLNEPADSQVLDAGGATFENALEITEVFRAEPEGPGCTLELDRVLFLGTGNEPGWQLKIRTDGATLTSAMLPAPAEFQGGTRVSMRIFEFDGADSKLTARFSEVGCYDTMSGAYYSHEVEMSLGSARYTGCATPGHAKVFD